MSVLNIQTEWLRGHFDALARIGAEPDGGVTRLALTPSERAARDFIGELMERLDLSVRLDEAGNLFGRRPGRRHSAPVVLTGSHVDTVPHGGRFDGSIGVLASLASLEAMDRAGLETDLPIDAVVFVGEESSRFPQGGFRFGSRAMAGLFHPDDLDRVTDGEGISMAEAMSGIGLDPHQVANARVQPEQVSSFVEAHIEQGCCLAEASFSSGCITAITGSIRHRVSLTGLADHSGGARMNARRDALAAAAEVVLDVEERALAVGGSLVATVGELRVEPNSITVVPGRAVLGIDLRDTDAASVREAAEAVIRRVKSVAARREIEVEIELLRDEAPVQMSPQVQAEIRRAAAEVGVELLPLPSRTGHDTASLANITRVGMVFIRNRSGRSHCPAEHVDWQDVEVGTGVLAATLSRLASPSKESA